MPLAIPKKSKGIPREYRGRRNAADTKQQTLRGTCSAAAAIAASYNHIIASWEAKK
jgi:hypothetical protein